MEVFMTFLANNTFIFTLIALILIFAIVGYFVDQKEQEKGISKIIHRSEDDYSIDELLAKAQTNQSLNGAINKTSMNNDSPNVTFSVGSNIITDTTKAESGEVTSLFDNGMDVLKK